MAEGGREFEEDVFLNQGLKESEENVIESSNSEESVIETSNSEESVIETSNSEESVIETSDSEENVIETSKTEEVVSGIQKGRRPHKGLVWGFWSIAFFVCFLSFVFSPQHIQDRLLDVQFWIHSLQRITVGFSYIVRYWHLVENWVFVKLPEPVSGEAFKFSLLWMAPFFSAGGYSSEAISYAEALVESKFVPQFQIMQHGDLYNHVFLKGLPSKTKETLVTLMAGEVDVSQSVVICHSEPGAWYPPLFQTTPCPPGGYEQPLYVIGRTMFETDMVNANHVDRCNLMDEVWIPTDFHMGTFARSGVHASKLVKVPQIVDVHFFDPSHVQASRMPAGRCLCGNCRDALEPQRFVFLSIFKWEIRKGWDILIKAYMQEFSVEDNVVLYLLTNAFHSDHDFGSKIQEFVRGLGDPRPLESWPTLYLLDEHVPQTKLPGLYKLADAFVLPSRGEGWGRPHVEAMAMGLPVIATNWSGMTEYMTEDNSYPIPVARLVEVKQGPFKGHQWAEPSLEGLQQLMRHVMSNQLEAKAKGSEARETMVSKFSPEVVGLQIVSHFLRVQKLLESRQSS